MLRVSLPNSGDFSHEQEIVAPSLVNKNQSAEGEERLGISIPRTNDIVDNSEVMYKEPNVGHSANPEDNTKIATIKYA